MEAGAHPSHLNFNYYSGLLARPERFELPTPRFVVWCSIQLSYGRLALCAGSGPAGKAGGTGRIGIGFAPARQGMRIPSPGTRWRRPSRPRPLAAPGVELHRPVRDGEAEGRADSALDQADLAAMGAHQLGHDGEAEPDAAGAR
jgi:hypothetical protein